MTLSESVATLSTLLPALKANDAKFASDLIASFKKYGGLTPKQEPWIGKLIARASAPVAPVAAAVNVGGFSGVVALFAKASASKLKFPKIRLVLNGTKIILSLNGPKSKRPGHVSISGEGVYPNRAFYGSVSPEGVFSPFKSELPGLTALLSELASNPARVAKDHGKLTGNCCFCGKGVGYGKEERSALVGFGPDCAEHYGLKAEWLAGVAKAEAKASVSVLAESLAKATGSVSVTVTDGPVSATFNADELQAELGPEYGTSEFQAKQAYDAAADQAKNDDDKAQDAASSSAVVCFFCEQPTLQYATLKGFTVCPSCVAQLK